ncbi:hypothetical protein RirG_108020 [Rhizophagus irregularis DAOM 197198w]|uniref:Uncharacterized protein n=1 Tax=Rhizophagus irregularis (strain DAOM 197198w) TaxID=1432141 RepID=A0A015MMU0_RHIIW|nr:hypothetical protein RirG_108020 [Rhizophagus irregularis DAOM 197198w]
MNHNRNEFLIALIVTQRTQTLSVLRQILKYHKEVDKVAFRVAYDAIPDTSKLWLSTGKIVEDVLFEFAKDVDYASCHSCIVNHDDENVKLLFTDVEWKELTEDRIGVPPGANYGKNVRRVMYDRDDDVS